MVISVKVAPMDSVKLQKLINKIGNVSAHYHFSEGDYPISSQIKFYSNTKITSDPGARFSLIDNASVKVFGLQVPVFTQKTSTIKRLDVSGISYNGNYEGQPLTPNDHGLGYGNAFGFTSLSDSYFHDMDLGHSEGDIFRLNYCTGIDIKVNSKEFGHDVVHLKGCSNVKVHDCKITLRANNGVRIRDGENISVINNDIDGSTNKAWSPAIQIENKPRGVLISGNYVHDIFGSGVWGMGGESTHSASEITIRNNFFRNCGKMPAANEIPGVGGIVSDGLNLNILSNTFYNSLGYGVLLGKYVSTSEVTGCSVSISENLFLGTAKSHYPGKASGTAIANLTGSKHKVILGTNYLRDNVADYYGMPETALA